MFKRLPALIFFLVAVYPASGQVTGALITAHPYDPIKNTVTLRITNTSGKDITAYNIKIKETYGTAVNQHEYMTDTVQTMLMAEEDAHMRAILPPGTLQPGASKEEIMRVQPGLTNYEAVIDTVTYADKTAETVNQPALDRILQNRKAEAATMLATNEIIRKALANAQGANPEQTAANEIEALRKSNNHSLSLSPGMMEAAIRELRTAPQAAAQERVSVMAHLTNYLDKRDQHAAHLSEHATVKVGGAQ
jgi:hypothetical protein